jgi:hypothetical protein
MKLFAIGLVCGILIAADVRDARAEWRVGATAETLRVLRDDPPPGGASVQLAAARNEWRSFQVFMRSDAPLGGVNLAPGDLRGPGGAVIRGADAVLYREHQMELAVATPRNDGFKPDWYPDPLIPFKDPTTAKPLEAARFVAVPFDLPAGETHAFWVDVYVPADVPPGEYRGTYRLTAADVRPVEVPVTLTVWDFRLPETPSLQTAFGSPAGRVRGYYRQLAREGKAKEPADWAAVETQCAEMLARHRVNATPPDGTIAPKAQADGTFRIPASETAALREFVDRYRINAFEVPHPKAAVKDPEAEPDKLRAWLKAWDQAAAELGRPEVVFYVYLIDEPNDAEAYAYVRKWGKAIRDARSVVKVMVTEQTWTQDEKWGDLYGAVDIWCPLFSLFKPASAAPRQLLGETIWAYTALCQQEPTPWWHIDYPLLNYRAPAWIAWRFRIRGLLYWGGMSHWKEVEDPWTDPRTYRPGKDPAKKGPAYNGEGTLVYPARAAGYEGIAPSLRLKALRDSIEDYEYLAILERAGLAAEAEEVVLPLAGSWFQWEKDPAAYEKARAKLADLIAGLKKPAR